MSNKMMLSRIYFQFREGPKEDWNEQLENQY